MCFVVITLNNKALGLGSYGCSITMFSKVNQIPKKNHKDPEDFVPKMLDGGIRGSRKACNTCNDQVKHTLQYSMERQPISV